MSPQDDAMHCDTVLDLIESWMDDEVEAEVALRIHHHLENCSDCAREAATARLVLTELRSIPELDLPPAVMDQVRTAVYHDGVKDLDFTRVNRRMGWIAAAAAAVIAFGAVTLSHRPQEPPDPEALRAAAEVTWAIATVGRITHRANLAIKDEVIDQRVIPVAVRGFFQPFQRYTYDDVSGVPPAASPTNRLEGSS